MRPTRVLVVEDEALAALVLEDLLADLGCEVVASFAQLAPALRWLAEQPAPPDGAVLDVNLGGEVVVPLAEALEARRVPFAFATGYSVLPDARFAAAPLLQKPLDLPRLAEAVRSFEAEAR